LALGIVVLVVGLGCISVWLGFLLIVGVGYVGMGRLWDLAK
jgi:hypothetical protein